MSLFLRSSSGMSNLHLFHNVHFVVYLEGGISVTKSDAYSGSFTEETEDILFWTRIFHHFHDHTLFKFKSIGSKTTIKEIASDILSGSITSVLVAMDNEFDEIFNSRLNHPQIFYTNGYSWENDVWNIDTINKVIFNLTAIQASCDLKTEFQLFLKNIKIGVLADGYLFKNESSFFNRKGSRMFCIECNPYYLPFVKSDVLQEKLNSLSLNTNTLKSFGRRKNISAQKFCYGHLLSDFSCQLISHYITKKHSLSKMPKDILNRMAITQLFSSFDSSEVYDYYRLQFSRI